MMGSVLDNLHVRLNGPITSNDVGLHGIVNYLENILLLCIGIYRRDAKPNVFISRYITDIYLINDF